MLQDEFNITKYIYPNLAFAGQTVSHFLQKLGISVSPDIPGIDEEKIEDGEDKDIDDRINTTPVAKKIKFNYTDIKSYSIKQKFDDVDGGISIGENDFTSLDPNTVSREMTVNILNISGLVIP